MQNGVGVSGHRMTGSAGKEKQWAKARIGHEARHEDMNYSIQCFFCLLHKLLFKIGVNK